MQQYRRNVFLSMCVLMFLAGLWSAVRAENNVTSNSTQVTSKAPMKVLSKNAKGLLDLNNFIRERTETMIKQLLPDMLSLAYETNVSATCTSAFLDLVRGLRAMDAWAFRMIDSTGKFVSGTLEGTIVDFGAYDQCLDLLVTAKDVKTYGDPDREVFRGKYCVVDARGDFENLDIFDKETSRDAEIGPSHLFKDHGLSNFFKRNNYLSLRYALCVPSECTTEDINEAVKYLSNIHLPAFSITVPRCEVKEPLEIDNTQLGILIALGAVILIVIVGTLLDMFGEAIKPQEEEKGKSCVVLSSLLCTAKKILTSFSITTNTRKLFNLSKQSATFKELDGIRFFSSVWVIVGHTYFYTNIVHYRYYRGIVKVLDVDDDIIFSPVANFTLSVDTFFFISGLLIVYSNWKKLEKSDGKLDIIYFIVHRIWRVYPAYLLAIGLTILVPLIGSGPQWYDAVVQEANNCREYWWTNLAFINNFLPVNNDHMCLLHTWYLAASMQFHIISFFILIALYRWTKIGFILSAILTGVCAILTYLHFHLKDVKAPTIVSHYVFGDPETKVVNMYVKPYVHIGAYFVGMAAGYIFLKYRKVEFGRAWTLAGWCISTIIAGAIVWGPLEVWRENNPNSIATGIYAAVHRTFWAVSIAWIVFACSTERAGLVGKFLSLKIFMPLGNLSYLAYLIHPLHLFIHSGRARERIFFSHYEVAMLCISRTVIVFALCYLFYVTIELPFAKVEEYIFRWNSRKPPKKAEPLQWNSGKDISSSIVVTLTPAVPATPNLVN